MSETIKQRIFSNDDQIDFAKLSGDYNPLHIDNIAARRFLFGNTVVHGIHTLLWALDCFFQHKETILPINSIKAVFNKPIFPGEKVICLIQNDSKSQTKISLLSNDLKTTTLTLTYGNELKPLENTFYNAYPKHDICKILKTEELESKQGNLNLFLNLEFAKTLFPNLLNYVGSIYIAELLATTRLVGMECPGYHSIYGELQISFVENSVDSKLYYRMIDFDKRFSSIKLGITAPGIEGEIKAFVRPYPKRQPSFNDLAKTVDRSEFTHQRSLIVGGSRGLGEVTAKLLAAGNADVRITYNRGKEEAENIVKEIIEAGGIADHLHYNVLDPKTMFADCLGDWIPTHLYYFATPFIQSTNAQPFNITLLNKLCQYYVSGFINTLKEIEIAGYKVTHVFYPSSIFVNDPPNTFLEYVSAKTAGEIICNQIAEKTENVRIYKPRLPRMATDQTSSLLSADNKDPAPILLKHLREFQNFVP